MCGSARARVVVDRLGGLDVHFWRGGARIALGPEIGALEKLEDNLLKYLLDVLARFGAALDKHHAVLARKALAVSARHNGIVAVDLVGDEQLNHIVVRAVHRGLLGPRLDAFKRCAVRHVVRQHDALCAAIVRGRERSLKKKKENGKSKQNAAKSESNTETHEFLLASCVPD